MSIELLVSRFRKRFCCRSSEALSAKLTEGRKVLCGTCPWRSIFAFNDHVGKIVVRASVLIKETFSRVQQRVRFSGFYLFSALFSVLRFVSDGCVVHVIYVYGEVVMC